MADLPTNPEANLIKSADLARVREADFTLMFGQGIKGLKEALGVTRMVKKPVGADIVAYKTTGTLYDGTPVPEGEIIPLSKYATEQVELGKVALKKYRKATTIEAILEKGFDQAVTGTTNKMLKDVQGVIKGDFFTVLQTTSNTVSGVGLQGAMAQAWGGLQVAFEDDDVETVYFANPVDVADYLGTAQVTMQTAFGLSYIENFLGLGTVILSSKITAKTVVATAKSNIIGYFADVKDSDIAKAFDFTTDDTGLIGIHEASDYSNLTSSDTVVTGVKFFPEYIGGIVKASITTASAENVG